MASNGSSNNGNTVPVNGSTNGWEPDVRDKIILALRTNGGLNRIQTTMRERLDEAGWSQDLKEYCTKLFRSGEAATYDDALNIIMKNILNEEDDPPVGQDGVQAPNLSIPQECKEAGGDAVKKELKEVVVQK